MNICVVLLILNILYQLQSWKHIANIYTTNMDLMISFKIVNAYNILEAHRKLIYSRNWHG